MYNTYVLLSKIYFLIDAPNHASFKQTLINISITQKPINMPLPISELVQDMENFTDQHEQCPNNYLPTKGKLDD